MKKILPENVRMALFGDFYFDKEAGELISSYALSEKADPRRYQTLPVYSMAFIRQQFVDIKNPSREKLQEYGLDKFPCFSLMEKDFALDTQYDYISKSHTLCEDEDWEKQFWEFFKKETLPLAERWCNEINDQYADG